MSSPFVALVFVLTFSLAGFAEDRSRVVQKERQEKQEKAVLKNTTDPGDVVDLKFPNTQHRATLPQVVQNYLIYSDAKIDQKEIEGGCLGRNVYAFWVGPSSAKSDAKEITVLTDKCVMALETDGKRLYVQTRDTEKKLDDLLVVETITASAKTAQAFPKVLGPKATGWLSPRFGSAVDLARKNGTTELARNASRTMHFRVRDKWLYVLISAGEPGKVTHFLDAYAISDQSWRTEKLSVLSGVSPLPIVDFEVDNDSKLLLAFDSPKRDGFGEIFLGAYGATEWKKIGSQSELDDTKWDGIKGADLAVAQPKFLQFLPHGFVGTEQRVRDTIKAFVFYYAPGTKDSAYQLFHLPRRNDTVTGLRSYKDGLLVADGYKFTVKWYGNGTKSPFPKDFEPQKLSKETDMAERPNK